jgi:hypothetical protein
MLLSVLLLSACVIMLFSVLVYFQRLLGCVVFLLLSLIRLTKNN